MRLYGQNWESVKHRHFDKDDDPGDVLANAAMQRVQRVVDCSFDNNSDDLNKDILNIVENDTDDIPSKDVNEVISFKNIFENLCSNRKSDGRVETNERFTDDEKVKSAPVEDKSDAVEPTNEKDKSAADPATTDVAEDKSAAAEPSSTDVKD